MNQPDIVALEHRPDGDKVSSVNVHQGIHFVFWSLPVFHTERVKGEYFDTEIYAVYGDLFYGFAALTMAEYAGLAFFLSPPAVAIHNDGNVSGYLLRPDSQAVCGFLLFFFEALFHLFVYSP
jgi:hypothetical protein